MAAVYPTYVHTIKALFGIKENNFTEDLRYQNSAAMTTISRVIHCTHCLDQLVPPPGPWCEVAQVQAAPAGPRLCKHNYITAACSSTCMTALNFQLQLNGGKTQKHVSYRRSPWGGGPVKPGIENR